MSPSLSGAMLTLCLLVGGLPISAQPASPQEPPIRTKNFLLIGGHESVMNLGRLEPGRGYWLRLILRSQSSPSDEGHVALEVESGTRSLLRVTVDRSASEAFARFTPVSRENARLRIGGVGELSAAYQARVEWRAEPESRMMSVDYIPSPNQGARPANATVTAVVVHATVTPTTEATVGWFLTQRSQVSAHYVVGRDGRIVQMVDDTARAWHAGVSELAGVKGVNDFSVGIEIVNLNDGRDPFTDAQYEAVAAIIRHIREQYDIPDSRIVSHEFVARPPGRKNDPKGFDFPRLLRLTR